MYRKYIEERMQGMLDILSESVVVEGKLLDKMRGKYDKIMKVSKVDVEVSWGGGKTFTCVLLDPEDHNDSGVKQSVKFDVPKKFLDPNADEVSVSDAELLKYAEKTVKRYITNHLLPYRVVKVFLH